MPPTLRPAERKDYSALSSFINSLNYLHRHLDWRDTLEWLGRSPFWICEENNQIQATLAIPPEPDDVAWVRLFAVSMHTSPDRAWQRLFERCLEDLKKRSPAPTIVSLALREWYEDLLKRNGFIYHQDIVVFMFDDEPPAALPVNPAIHLREMNTADLEEVMAVDHLAFEPIWRLSSEDLRFAAAKSSYCTIAELDGRIIGYTMSSSSGMYAHLARLAVHPDIQRQNLGYSLVQDLLVHFINDLSYWGVTLNTQHDNHASIALYHKVGFRETGERFPVFIYRY
jgi:ribosomal protein S18 acetylase RimI-like enzyme